jgi:hypothetical protein
MLGTGAINTLSKKIQNQCYSVGIDGKKEPFSKPWSQTLVMFSGEACLIFVFLIQQRMKRSSFQKRPDIQILEPESGSFNSVSHSSSLPVGSSVNSVDESQMPLLGPAADAESGHATRQSASVMT